MPIFFPPPIRLSKVCDRCGLWYPKKKEQCTHCHGMNDAEVAKLKEKYEEFYEGNAYVGRQFLVVAIVAVTIVLAVLVLAIFL